jgi:hypothetical protein
MKFMAKTTMYTATFRDLSLATAQGTLVDSPLAGYRAAKSRHVGPIQTYLIFAMACTMLVYGMFKYRQAKQRSAKSSGKNADKVADDWSSDKPLVFA